MNLKQLKQHVKSYEPALDALQKERRACMPQAGFVGQPFNLSNEDKKLVIKHLALSLYCNQPPVRLDMGHLIIYEGEVLANPEPNYLHCADPSERPYPKYVAYWTEFKTAKFRKGKDGGPSEPVISPFKAKVCKHVFESLKLWPRRHILSLLENPNKPLGKSRLASFLNEAGPKPGLGVDLLRHIYITETFKYEVSQAKRKELADAMHHTVDTQRALYERKGKPTSSASRQRVVVGA